MRWWHGFINTSKSCEEAHAGSVSHDMPEAMTELDRNVPMLDLNRPQAERDLFGYSFAEVGATLALEWRFPAPTI